MRGLGLLTLRVIVGIGSLAHGLPKLIPVWGSSPRDTVTALDAAGVGWTYLVTVGTGTVELLGGVLLLAGAYTVGAALALAATTTAVGAVVYLPHGYFLNWALDTNVQHGYEFHLLRVGALLCVLLAGPGALAFDGRRGMAAGKK